MNESEIGGGPGRRVQKRAARGSLKSAPKRVAFTLGRRKKFLTLFAATCNAAAAARAVGVSQHCIYAWRRKDEQFRAAWKEALDQGYARLEAELVKSATRSLNVRAKAGAKVSVNAMDAKTALAVLNAFRCGGGRNPGDVWPHAYDMEAVRARLEAKMKMLKLIQPKPVEGEIVERSGAEREAPAREREARDPQ